MEGEHDLQVTDPDYVPSREDLLGRRELLADMEREIYVDNMKIRYSGYFSYKELITLIDRWCTQRGYFKEIEKQKHKLTKTGKNMTIDFQMHRKFTSVHLSVLYLTLSADNVTDVTTELDGRTVILNKGDVEITFNGFLMSHIKGRWESKPKFALIRKFIDKWIYKLDRPSLAGTVVGDAKELAGELRASLFVYKHKLEAKEAMEEAEKKAIEEEKKEAEKK